MPWWTCALKSDHRSFSSLHFVPHSPRLVLIKASPPKISRRDVYLQVPPISRPRSSPSRLSYRPVWLTVTGFRGIHACTASLLSTASEARVSVNLPPRQKRYVHRSRAMFLLILHDSRVKGARNSVSWNFRGIFRR